MLCNQAADLATFFFPTRSTLLPAIVAYSTTVHVYRQYYSSIRFDTGTIPFVINKSFYCSREILYTMLTKEERRKEEQRSAKNKQRRDKRKVDRANGIPPIKRDQSKRKKQDRRNRDQSNRKQKRTKIQDRRNRDQSNRKRKKQV